MESLMARMPRILSARDALVEANIGLVVHIAQRIANRLPLERDRDDLMAAGMVGLVEAATRFEPSRGMPFSSFAGLRIEGAILDTLRQADRLPRSVRQLQRRIDAAEYTLTVELGRMPSSVEVAAAVGLSLDELHGARTSIAAGTVESIDRTSGEEAAGIADVVVDPTPGLDELVVDAESAAAVRKAMGTLSERHRFVIIGCMFENRPLRELAATLGVTRSRVSQLKDEAIRHLRQVLTDQPTIDLTATVTASTVRARRDMQRAMAMPV
jgi:RNA polymerase sigma factor FliA